MAGTSELITTETLPAPPKKDELLAELTEDQKLLVAKLNSFKKGANFGNLVLSDRALVGKLLSGEILGFVLKTDALEKLHIIGAVVDATAKVATSKTLKISTKLKAVSELSYVGKVYSQLLGNLMDAAKSAEKPKEEPNQQKVPGFYAEVNIGEVTIEKGDKKGKSITVELASEKTG